MVFVPVSGTARMSRECSAPGAVRNTSHFMSGDMIASNGLVVAAGTEARPVRFRRPAACQIADLFARVEMKITSRAVRGPLGANVDAFSRQTRERVSRDVVDLDVGGVRAEHA